MPDDLVAKKRVGRFLDENGRRSRGRVPKAWLP